MKNANRVAKSVGAENFPPNYIMAENNIVESVGADLRVCPNNIMPIIMRATTRVAPTGETVGIMVEVCGSIKKW